MPKKQYTRKGDVVAYVIADILARIGFFIGTAVALQYYFMTDYSPIGWGAIELFVTIAASTLAAIFGPYLYKSRVMQGRGSLRDVKERSRDDR